MTHSSLDGFLIVWRAVSAAPPLADAQRAHVARALLYDIGRDGAELEQAVRRGEEGAGILADGAQLRSALAGIDHPVVRVAPPLATILGDAAAILRGASRQESMAAGLAEILAEARAGSTFAVTALTLASDVLARPGNAPVASVLVTEAAAIENGGDGLPRAVRDLAPLLNAMSLVAASTDEQPVHIWAVNAALSDLDPGAHAQTVNAANRFRDRVLERTADAGEAIDPEDERPLEALGSSDHRVRRDALIRAQTTPAFRDIETADEDDFDDYIDDLSELYFGGIRDEDETVRAAAVVFGRRLAFGYAQRGHAEQDRAWLQQIRDDTRDGRHPRLVRAHLLAQYDLVARGRFASPEERLEAFTQFTDALLRDPVTDAAACVRGDALGQLVDQPDAEDGCRAYHAWIEAMVLALDRDEYYQYDFPKRVTDAAVWLAGQYLQEDRNDEVLRAMTYAAPLALATPTERVRLASQAQSALTERCALDPAFRAQHGARIDAIGAAYDLVDRRFTRSVRLRQALDEATHAEVPDIAAVLGALGELESMVPTRNDDRLGLVDTIARSARWLYGRSVNRQDHTTATSAVALYLRNGADAVDDEGEETMALIDADARQGFFAKSSRPEEVAAVYSALQERAAAQGRRADAKVFAKYAVGKRPWLIIGR